MRRQVTPRSPVRNQAKSRPWGEKWFNHFRLQDWLAKLSLDMYGSSKPLAISDSTKMDARL